jgi:hypothetical protein
MVSFAPPTQLLSAKLRLWWEGCIFNAAATHIISCINLFETSISTHQFISAGYHLSSSRNNWQQEKYRAHFRAEGPVFFLVRFYLSVLVSLCAIKLASSEVRNVVYSGIFCIYSRTFLSVLRHFFLIVQLETRKGRCVVYRGRLCIYPRTIFPPFVVLFPDVQLQTRKGRYVV